jgi:hypothetical protein
LLGGRSCYYVSDLSVTGELRQSNSAVSEDIAPIAASKLLHDSLSAYRSSSRCLTDTGTTFSM